MANNKVNYAKPKSSNRDRQFFYIFSTFEPPLESFHNHFIDNKFHHLIQVKMFLLFLFLATAQAWTLQQVHLPNGTVVDSNQPLNFQSNDFVLLLAEMSAMDYTDESLPHFNDTDFGNDGLKGLVFTNGTLTVLSFKGTSLFGSTSANDKLVDNLMFSCCNAGRCQINATTCSLECLRNQPSYYQSAVNVAKTTQPDYITGHSLGGAVASLVSQTLKIPTFTFESPGDEFYSRVLGLTGSEVVHLGNNADPIFLGTCQGYLSTCELAGYYLQTGCHTGKTCTYNATAPESVYYHQISVAIVDFIEPMPMPECRSMICQDCADWLYV